MTTRFIVIFRVITDSIIRNSSSISSLVTNLLYFKTILHVQLITNIRRFLILKKAVIEEITD